MSLKYRENSHRYKNSNDELNSANLAILFEQQACVKRRKRTV